MDQSFPDAARRDTNGRQTASPLLSFLSLVLLASCSFAPRASAVRIEDSDAPESIVSAFYQICVEEKITGLPTDEQFEQLGPLLSDRLHGLLADARMEQAEYSREYPDEKPPWVEGDLFSSLFEGPTRFKAGTAEVEGDHATVTVSFADDNAGTDTPFEWNDDVILVRNKEGDWRIDDVVYRGDWDFASKGTLSESLTPRESAHEEE